MVQELGAPPAPPEDPNSSKVVPDDSGSVSTCIPILFFYCSALNAEPGLPH